MNEQLQTQFDRVETALNTLIDSITSYKPSLSAATSLVEADDDLSKGLEQLSTHQANYQTLVSLRATSAALDNQIKSSLALLADTRKELLTSTPLTPVPSSESGKALRKLEYNDLLNYAQRIARFAVPPARHRVHVNLVDDSGPSDAPSMIVPTIKQEAPSPAPLALHQQPSSTPLPTPGPLPASPVPPTSSHFAAPLENKAFDSLPESTKAWLDPTTSLAQFTPWPAEDVIRRGALAMIQGMMESGVDPASMGTELDAQGLREYKPEDEAKQQDEAVAASGERNKDKRPTGGPRREEKPRQESKEELSLGFDLYDPGDE